MYETIATFLLAVPKQYAVHALAIALLMVLFYKAITNPKLIDVADRVLNQNLIKTHLYKIVRLLVILVFSFSILVILTVFASMLLSQRIANESLSLVLQAQKAFKNKDYEKARNLYSMQLAASPDDPSSEQIKGMITATFYGQQLHRQGLNFLCKEYKQKPKDFHGYLFAVHAHLRAIAVSEGTQASEAIAREMQEKCNSLDFSQFWVHIPFGMMESLRVGILRYEHPWKISEESAARLNQLMDESKKRQQSDQPAHGDYVDYFLGNFDRVIALQPNSKIRDSALFDAAHFSEGDRRYRYLKQLISEYPNAPRLLGAYEFLIASLANAGRTEEAIAETAEMSKHASVTSTIFTALEPTVKKVRTLISQAEFEQASLVSGSACSITESKGIACIRWLKDQGQKATKAAKMLERSSSLEVCRQNQEKLRSFRNSNDNEHDVAWLKGAYVYLDSCLELADPHDADYGRILYLMASVSRQLHEYKRSYELLKRFIREIPDHDLLDDVYTELGWHILLVQDQPLMALKYFNYVIEKFPDRNAYDNAVWWAARAHKESGEYSKALMLYAELGTKTAISRFADWSIVQEISLRKLLTFPPLSGLRLKKISSQDRLFRIGSVEINAPMANILKPGDFLLHVCGVRANTIDEILEKVSNLMSMENCSVLFRRDSTLIRITGSETAGWMHEQKNIPSKDVDKYMYGILK